VQSSTDASKIEGNLIQGGTIGTVNITGYASLDIHVGCSGRASTSIDWVRKYDCDNDMIYILFSGAGRSSIAGDIEGLATLYNSLDASCEILNASSANGPTSIYEKYTQQDGYGLSYTGGPISFSSTDDGPFSTNVGDYDTLYLQSFNLVCNPGQLSIATYSFIYLPMGGTAG
jgi:hypothetical protein